VTGDALDFTLETLGLADAGVRDRLMGLYRTLDCFPEVPDVLRRLKDAGFATAILSNGSPRMLSAAVASSGLAANLEHVLSVDAVRTYKPSPLVYALAPQALGIPAGDLLFVSSNAWDVAGAKSFGFQVAWCNRADAPAERLGAEPDLVVRSLADLPR